MFSFLANAMMTMLSSEETPPPSIEEPSQIFQNHLILENLFKFCSFSELCQSRLVCREWHYASLPYWRSKASLRVYIDQKDAAFERKNYITMSDLIGTLDNVNSAPMDSAKVRYRLAGWPYINFQLHYFRDYEKNRFWTECGAWIVSLQLVSCHLPNYEEYKSIILSKYTPGLKSLKIVHGNSFHRMNNSNRSTTATQTSESSQSQNLNLESLTFISSMPELPWMEMLSSYPAIKTLEICYPMECSDWENNLNEMLTAVTSIRSKCRSRINLKGLRVQKMDQKHGPSLSSPVYLQLANLSVPLESLTLDTEFFVDEFSLKSVLSAYQPTLKRLKLCGSYLLADQPLLRVLQLPEMTHLQELIMTVNTFRNMDILQYTPNLKLLYIINPWRSRTLSRCALRAFLTCSQTVKLESVRKLRYDYDCTAVDLFRLITWMPNVERLEMPLTNDSFRVVCQYWPNLRWLNIHRDKVDDDGIIGNCTGLPEITERKDFQEYFNISYETQPNIRHLKYLHTFIMENHRYTHDEEADHLMQRYNDVLFTKLTEKSITHGFLHMGFLQKLSISVYDNSVSEKAVQSLKNVIPDVNVRRLPCWTFGGTGCPPD